MTRTEYRLFAALALSLSLHLLPFLPSWLKPPAQPARPAPMHAELRQPPAPEPASLPLKLPDPPKPAPSTEPSAAQTRPANTPQTWSQAVREHLKTLEKNGQFYPAEAIAQGLQGDVQVFMVIDESGKVVAARVETSSGHALLDDAALRAVRSVSSLPADSPRDTLLWLRFRLK